MNINIISYNACLFVHPPLRFNGAFARAQRFAQTLYGNLPDPSAIDIICFQEFIVNRTQMLKDLHLHPFHTKVDYGDIFGDNIRFLQSGLTIVSKHPIVEQKNHVFTGPGYHAETLIPKSIQYAKIKINDHFVHILNTHLQAWSEVTAQKARISQMKQIATFYKSLNVPKHEPVILCGDFNFDFYEHNDTLMEAMEIVDFSMHLPSTPQFSFDPTVNQLVCTDDESQYKTQSDKNGCYESFLETGICHCCPKHLIDGACTSNANLKPVSTTTKVIQNFTSAPFEIYINISTKRFIDVVSDHFPVLCELQFPLNPPIDLDIPITISDTKDYTSYYGWVALEFVFFFFLYGMFVLLIHYISKRQ